MRLICQYRNANNCASYHSFSGIAVLLIDDLIRSKDLPINQHPTISFGVNFFLSNITYASIIKSGLLQRAFLAPKSKESVY